MVLYSRSYPSTCVDLQECSFREKSDYWLTCEPWVFSIIRLLKCVCVNTLNCFPKAWLFYSHQIILYPCIFTLSGCLKPITKGAIVYWSRFSLGERSNGLRVNYTQHIIREAYCVWNLELLSWNILITGRFWFCFCAIQTSLSEILLVSSHTVFVWCVVLMDCSHVVNTTLLIFIRDHKESLSVFSWFLSLSVDDF